MENEGGPAMKSRKVRRFATLFLSAGFLCAAVVQAARPQEPEEVMEVTVEAHQTLWDIAAAHTGDDRDIRRAIYDIQRLNQISNPGAIQPGQIIRIPNPAR